MRWSWVITYLLRKQHLDGFVQNWSFVLFVLWEHDGEREAWGPGPALCPPSPRLLGGSFLPFYQRCAMPNDCLVIILSPMKGNKAFYILRRRGWRGVVWFLSPFPLISHGHATTMKTTATVLLFLDTMMALRSSRSIVPFLTLLPGA